MRKLLSRFALVPAGCLALFAAGLAQGETKAAGGKEPEALLSVVVSPSSKATLCLEANSAVKAALQSGARRRVLVVTSYQPPETGGASLVVTSAQTGQRSVLGLFPSQAFKSDSPESHWRFYLPRDINAGAAEECYDVELQVQDSGTAPTKASAKVSLEIQPEPKG